MSDSKFDKDVLPKRIAERLAALGLSERAASIEATGQPDALRFIRTRGVNPSAARLMKIARVLQATTGYLTGVTDVNDWEGDKGFIQLASTMDDDARERFREGREVPVLATVVLQPPEEPDPARKTSIYHFKEEVLTFAAAPLGVKRGVLGAFYPADSSMAPAFEPQVPAVFILEQEADVGDYALIFLKLTNEDGLSSSSMFILRRIVDRGSSWITVEQFNPPLKSRIDAQFLSKTRKVLSMRDYVTPDIPR